MTMVGAFMSRWSGSRLKMSPPAVRCLSVQHSLDFAPSGIRFERGKTVFFWRRSGELLGDPLLTDHNTQDAVQRSHEVHEAWTAFICDSGSGMI